MAAVPASAAPAPTRQPARRGADADRQRPPLHVVEPPRRLRRWVAVTLLTGLAGLAGITSLSAAGAEAAFQVSELERDIATLERVRDSLTGDVAELSSLERIERVATDELDMVPAEQARYVEAGPADRVPAAHVDHGPADPVKAARDGRW